MSISGFHDNKMHFYQHFLYQVDIMDFKKCEERFDFDSADSEKIICAGGKKKGACFVSLTLQCYYKIIYNNL